MGEFVVKWFRWLLCRVQGCQNLRWDQNSTFENIEGSLVIKMKLRCLRCHRPQIPADIVGFSFSHEIQGGIPMEP